MPSKQALISCARPLSGLLCTLTHLSRLCSSTLLLPQRMRACSQTTAFTKADRQWDYDSKLSHGRRFLEKIGQLQYPSWSFSVIPTFGNSRVGAYWRWCSYFLLNISIWVWYNTVKKKKNRNCDDKGRVIERFSCPASYNLNPGCRVSIYKSEGYLPLFVSLTYITFPREKSLPRDFSP